MIGKATKQRKEAKLKQQALAAYRLQEGLDNLETQLMQNPEFKRWVEAQKKAKQQIEATWKAIEAEMIRSDIRSITTDIGTLTIATKHVWDVDIDQLPDYYKKTVADTKRLTEKYEQTKTTPTGASLCLNRYLYKRLK